jgi:hypothetical protein
MPLFREAQLRPLQPVLLECNLVGAWRVVS